MPLPQQYYQNSGAPDAAGATRDSPRGPFPPPHRHGTNPLPDDDGKAYELEHEHSRRPLTFWPLLALIYYTSSGGPFGIEPIVGSVGPLLSIIGCVRGRGFTAMTASTSSP
jgi:hypothetical protein